MEWPIDHDQHFPYLPEPVAEGPREGLSVVSSLFAGGSFSRLDFGVKVCFLDWSFLGVLVNGNELTRGSCSSESFSSTK